MPDSVGRVILRTLGWLAPCFALWYAAGALVVWPASVLSALLARGLFGTLFGDVEQTGATLTFVTRLRPPGAAAAQAGAVATFDVNALIYTFGVPMLVALTLAARQPGLARRLALSLLALVPFQAWGIVADALQTVAIGLGPEIGAQTGFAA